jgi:TPR repeat protein
MADLNRAIGCTNDSDAFENLLHAAEAGCVRAQALVGLAYHTGHGVAVNFERAAGWYRKAAGSGDSYAMANLGVMCLLGEGEIADELDAYIWFQSAVGLGRKRLRPVLDVLEHRIVGDCGNSDRILAAVAPQTPPLRPCTRADCDPARCDNA